MANIKQTNNDLQNTTPKNKERVTKTQLKTNGELSVISFSSTSHFSRFTLIKNLVTSHQMGKNHREVLTTSGLTSHERGKNHREVLTTSGLTSHERGKNYREVLTTSGLTSHERGKNHREMLTTSGLTSH